jgi:aminopeptidase N
VPTIAQPPQRRFRLKSKTVVDPRPTRSLRPHRSRDHCTQCEAEGFRRITYFRRPDVMAVYTTRRGADRPKHRYCSPTAICRTGHAGHDAAFRGVARSISGPSYLFASSAASCLPEDRFRTSRGRDLRIYVEPGGAALPLCDGSPCRADALGRDRSGANTTSIFRDRRP